MYRVKWPLITPVLPFVLYESMTKPTQPMMSYSAFEPGPFSSR